MKQQTWGAQQGTHTGAKPEEAIAWAKVINSTAAYLKITESAEGGVEGRERAKHPSHFLSGAIPVKHVRQNHSVRQTEDGRGEGNQSLLIVIDLLQ